jgi:hypothetical protein
VDGPSLVAGLVLAQGVERHVAGGEVAGWIALEIADKTRTHAGKRHGLGVHVEFAALGPDDLPAHKTNGVGAHRTDRSDPHNPPAGGGNNKLGHKVALASETGKSNVDEAVTDGNLYRCAEEAGAPGVSHHNFAGRVIPHNNPGRHHSQINRQRGSAEKIQRRECEKSEAGPPDNNEFGPAGDVPDGEGERHKGAQKPAGRGNDRLRQCERGARRGAGSTKLARDKHQCFGDNTRAGSNETSASVGEPNGGMSGVGECASGARRPPRTGAGARRRSLRGSGAAGAHTGCRSLGGAVSSRICPITLDAVTPSNSASASSSRRWARTGSASTLTSSGIT